MVVIAGCIVKRDNKILMVKEAQKKCYGQWNFPAGHVEEQELVTDAAIREVYEETGCKVKLTGVLPIAHVILQTGETHIIVRFTADLVEENFEYDTEEILEVKWIDIEEIKQMTEKELRGYDTAVQLLKDFEAVKIYPLELFNTTKYYR